MKHALILILSIVSSSCGNYSKNPPQYTLHIEAKPTEAFTISVSQSVKLTHIYKNGMSSRTSSFKDGKIAEEFVYDIDETSGISISAHSTNGRNG